jgi:hypothetical protein
VASGELGHDMAFHISRGRAGRHVERSPIGWSGQRLIDPGYTARNCRTKRSYQLRHPRWIGVVELSRMHDLAADQADSRFQLLAQCAGNAEARNGSAAFRYGARDESGEAGCAPTARH